VDVVEGAGPDEGVNALLDRHRVARIDCGPEATPPDIDTPDDLQACAARIDADGLETNTARLLAGAGILNELKQPADKAEAQ